MLCNAYRVVAPEKLVHRVERDGARRLERVHEAELLGEQREPRVGLVIVERRALGARVRDQVLADVPVGVLVSQRLIGIHLETVLAYAQQH